MAVTGLLDVFETRDSVESAVTMLRAG
jgi:hypothetical protein